MVRHLGAWWGRRRFLSAISRIRPETEHCPAEGEALKVSLMAGRRHAALAFLALLSLRRACHRPVHPVVHDDGTLRPADRETLRGFFPETRFISAAETKEALDRVLPEATFPFLRKIRRGYLNLRKLTDVHAVGTGWTLVMDSDVIFLRRPVELLEAVEKSAWAHMVDCQTSYGCAVDLLESLAGRKVHPRLNAGLLHMNSPEVDWEFLEAAARAILAKEGFSYYLEQALLGVLMARKEARPLTARDYLVNPTEAQVIGRREVAHHFVDRSILEFYRHAWRPALFPGHPSFSP
jgi:hypothetical protein